MRSENADHFLPPCFLDGATGCAFLRKAFCCEVRAAWQWSNFYSTQCRDRGKLMVRINLDETSIPCYQGRSKGVVFQRSGKSDCPQQLAKAKRRKFLTLIAAVSDNSLVQSILPQVLIGNCHTFLKRDLAQLAEACSSNMVLIRSSLVVSVMMLSVAALC